jgi:hydrogenase maturation protease
MARILIAGFGNRLMADDGVGPVVADRLLEEKIPSGVRVLEAGTDSTRLPSLWKGEHMVWLVDAMARHAPPGTIHRLDHDAVMGLSQPNFSAHRLSLAESLRWIAHSYPESSAIEYRLWGVEPGLVGPRFSLSPEVALAVDIVAREIAGLAIRSAPKSCD